MSTWRKRKTLSPARAERTGRMSSLATSASRCRPANGRASSGSSSTTAASPELPVRPRRRARASRARPGPAGRAGRRAAPGSSAGSAALPARRCSASVATSCSRKRGFPSAVSSEAGARGVVEARRPGSAISAAPSASDRRSRNSELALSLPPAQAGALFEQLGPGEADDQHRRVALRLGEVLDEVEQRRLGPVDVLEHEDERAARARAPRTAAERPRRSPRRLRTPSPARRVRDALAAIESAIARSPRAARRAAAAAASRLARSRRAARR